MKCDGNRIKSTVQYGKKCGEKLDTKKEHLSMFLFAPPRKFTYFA